MKFVKIEETKDRCVVKEKKRVKKIQNEKKVIYVWRGKLIIKCWNLEIELSWAVCLDEETKPLPSLISFFCFLF